MSAMQPPAPLPVSAWRRRRQQVMRLAGANSAVLIAAAPEHVRSRDTLYPYRQDSDLWYLSGFPEPEAVLLLLPARRGGKVLLFCRERDPERERWDGPRIGSEAAVERYGVDAAWPIKQLGSLLPGLLDERTRIYCGASRPAALDAILAAREQRTAAASATNAGVADAAALTHELRITKDPHELRLMRHAARISVLAHAAAMRAVRPGLREYQLQAEIERVFRQHGAVPAYESIVGSGANACILHYRANDALIADGDLVLIDAGCEYAGYAADITRTFPANGRFTREQRALHDLVCAAQAAALKHAHPGALWPQMHTAAAKTLIEGLLRLGLLRGGSVETHFAAGSHQRFYPHKSGHWLGLDVHDVGAYEIDGQPRPLQPGMVLTIEPGLYIPPGTRGVSKKWCGIGIRIEDDILITQDGHEVLTAGLARSADEIEAEMGPWMY